jgi:hypothetical protein
MSATVVKNEMRVAHPREGDVKYEWDPNNSVEVDQARQHFNTMLAQRYAAFSMTRKGEKDERIHAFDPEAERILFVPPIAGG